MRSSFSIDGHDIAYEALGVGQPIVLLHGVSGDRAAMREPCEPVLKERPLRRIYIDLPGHGESKGNHASASADRLVDGLTSMIRGVCGPGERPLLAGYSYGGYLAQGLARDLALAGLFLACPVVEPDFGKRSLPARRVARREELIFGDNSREKPEFEEIAVVQTQAMLETFRRVIHPANLCADPEVVGALRFAYSMSRHYGGALAAFEAPVTIVCGRDDHWVGYEDAQRLARLFPAASMHVVADAGHLLPFEAPVDFQWLLGRWLDRAKEATP